MEVKKSLIAITVSTALLGGVWESAVAKNTDEEDSVYRWGRWAVLAPAAGVEEVIAFAPAGTNDLGRCETAANCPEPKPPEEEKSRLASYVRIDYLAQGEAPRHSVGGIALYQNAAGDSLGFKVSGSDPTVSLDSGLMPVTKGTDGFISTAGRGLSRINGKTEQGVDNVVLVEGLDPAAVVEGSWYYNGTGTPGPITMGEYVMGMTATPTQIAALIDQLDFGGEISAWYRGVTQNGGSIQLEMDFSNSSWNGRVHGVVLDFAAEGTLENAEFVATGFSGYGEETITGKMQGSLVNAGHSAIGSFDVQSDRGEGGVLREADIFNAGLMEPSVYEAAQ